MRKTKKAQPHGRVRPRGHEFGECANHVGHVRCGTERGVDGAAVRPQDLRVLIGGHFAPEVQTALKVIAAEERTTMQALLAEAINTVFAKRHKPEIADIATS